VVVATAAAAAAATVSSAHFSRVQQCGIQRNDSIINSRVNIL
jgi:hypothetical protein